MKKLLSLLVVVSVVLSCFTVSVFAEGQNVVNVNSAEALMNALASDTKIILAPGKYVLQSETVTEYYDDGSAWEYQIPKILFIDGMNNLTIEGNGKAEIVLDVGTAPVINIMNSYNVTFSGLILGHDVPEYGCEGEGYVIQMIMCDGVTVESCDLYGCGVEGINAFGCSNVTVNNTVIRDCMVRGIYVTAMKGDFTFNNCQFLRNAYDDYFAQTSGLIYASKRTAEGDSGNIYFNNCTFADNKNTQFVESYSNTDEYFVFHDGCMFSNNAWETAINVKSFEYGWWMTHYFEDQRPVIVEGRTLVPLRGVLENLGYQVTWNEATRSAVITKYDVDYEVIVTIDSNIIYKGGEAVEVDVPATIINGRTMVPIRAIAEAFDLKVEWDDDTRSVLIYVDEE